MKNRVLGRIFTWLAALVLTAASGCCMPESLATIARIQAKPAPPPKPPEPPMPPPEPFYEQLSLMSQKLHSVEDDRKVLSTRLQYLEGQLEEKERALSLATREIGAAREEMVRTRIEVQRWKEEITTLRNRLKGVEKENQATLESVIKFLEKLTQEEKPPPPKPEPSGPELPPLP